MSKLLAFVCTTLLALSLWKLDSLPEPATLVEALAAEPRQTPTRQRPFETRVKGVTYTVTPLYDYEIVGLVVSKHNADKWWDHFHADNHDNLNVTDLCVLWGDNALDGRYRDISFSSGQFTCNFETRSQEAYERFNQAQVSNNHLLADDDALTKLLKGVNIGDQVRVRGVLAEYSHQQGAGFRRGTSTVRTDGGNGACETIYVTDAQVLKPAGAQWRYLMWAALAGLALTLLVGLAAPVRAHR